MLKNLKDSITKQFHRFTNLHPTHRLAVVAKSGAAGFTAYAFTAGILPIAGLAVTAAVVCVIIAGKSAFKIEDRKQTREQRRQFYVDAITKLEAMFKEAEEESNRLLKAAKHNIKKEDGTPEIEEKNAEPTPESDFAKVAEEIRAKYPTLPENEIKKKIQAARVAFTRKVHQTIGRINGKRFRVGKAAIHELNDLIKEIESIKNTEQKTVVTTTEEKTEDNSQQANDKISNTFGMVVDTGAGALHAFVGAASTVYVLESTILGLGYQSPEVLAPALLLGSGASYFGGRIGYRDHQAEINELAEFDSFMKKLNELETKHLQILAVNKRIRKQFHLDEEEDDALEETCINIKDTLNEPNPSPRPSQSPSPTPAPQNETKESSTIELTNISIVPLLSTPKQPTVNRAKSPSLLVIGTPLPGSAPDNMPEPPTRARAQTIAGTSLNKPFSPLRRLSLIQADTKAPDNSQPKPPKKREIPIQPNNVNGATSTRNSKTSLKATHF